MRKIKILPSCRTRKNSPVFELSAKWLGYLENRMLRFSTRVAGGKNDFGELRMRVQSSLQSQGSTGAGSFLWPSACFSGGGDSPHLVPKVHEARAGAFELAGWQNGISSAWKTAIRQDLERRSGNHIQTGRSGGQRNAPGSFVGLLLLLAIMILLPFLAGSSMAQDFDHAHRLFDNVLKQFVDSGRVDYAGLKADNAALDQYLSDAASISEKQFKSWNEPRRLAFLFNLYNAATVKLILAHYPVKSIKDIGSLFKGPWDQRVVRLFGNVITLDELEHGILRKQYNEPRLHLALVCAAKGCPPLRSEAYTAERLNEQLEDQAKRFLSNPAAFQIDRVNKVVYLSSIFKWYGDDFRANYAPTTGFSGLNETHRAVSNFSVRYLSDRDRKYLEAGGYAVKFLDYDWSLNERKELR